MDLSLDNTITAKVVKAVAEFDLINDGDRVAVGLSGGKDSTFLLIVLKIFEKYFKINFYIEAVHVNPGFENYFDPEIIDLCKELKINLKIIDTEIAKYIGNEKNDNPCSKCAHFRKGAIINYLKQNDFNKLAFGHHLDDAVETFLMSIFYSGQLKTLQPKRFLSENKIDIIRPLIYLRESTIKDEISKKGIKPKKSPCPYDGNSGRSEVRENFNKYFNNEYLFSNLISAMREKDSVELWSEKMDYDKLAKKMKNYWR